MYWFPMLENLPCAGLFAAVVTPTGDDARLDLDAFDRVLDFLLAAGVSGICLGGATGEYPHFETAERKVLVQRASSCLGGKSPFVVGVGGPSVHHVLELGRVAMDAGSLALLLPMPMFFRYEQEDLDVFAREVARGLDAPWLLYNLPSFTNGLAPATIIDLLTSEERIVGLKDSSGDPGLLAAVAAARGPHRWALLVGDDRLLYRGLRAGWDGGISGIAGFCPEIVVGIYRNVAEGHVEEAARLQSLLDELIARVSVFPTPWGIRIGLMARGIQTGPLPLPCTARRREQIAAFTNWFRGWLPQTGVAG